MRYGLGAMLLFLILSLFLGGCVSSQQTYNAAALGGAVGAAAGAVIDDDNRWRGAVIGGALGSVLGGGLAEISQRAQRQAAYSGRPVAINTGDTYVLSEPMGVPYQRDAKTSCRKIRTRVWKNGQLQTDEIKEVCEATKVEPTY